MLIALEEMVKRGYTPIMGTNQVSMTFEPKLKVESKKQSEKQQPDVLSRPSKK